MIKMKWEYISEYLKVVMINSFKDTVKIFITFLIHCLNKKRIIAF
jgi:hypothetical protein